MASNRLHCVLADAGLILAPLSELNFLLLDEWESSSMFSLHSCLLFYSSTNWWDGNQGIWLVAIFLVVIFLIASSPAVIASRRISHSDFPLRLRASKLYESRPVDLALRFPSPTTLALVRISLKDAYYRYQAGSAVALQEAGP